jgi:hypothetical protein
MVNHKNSRIYTNYILKKYKTQIRKYNNKKAYMKTTEEKQFSRKGQQGCRRDVFTLPSTV